MNKKVQAKEVPNTNFKYKNHLKGISELEIMLFSDLINVALINLNTTVPQSIKTSQLKLTINVSEIEKLYEGAEYENTCLCNKAEAIEIKNIITGIDNLRIVKLNYFNGGKLYLIEIRLTKKGFIVKTINNIQKTISDILKHIYITE